MRKKLTERQQHIFAFIARTIKSGGAPPTIREIMEEFNISSTNGVRTTLAAIEKKGYIRRHARLSRGIELVDFAEPHSLQTDTIEIPLIGRVAAGAPILATENIETFLQIDPIMAPGSGTTFALRVHGESMKNAGILDGDIVLARQQENAERGDIVVALLDEEATVKRYQPEATCIRLLPENETFTPIVVSKEDQSFRIAGKVVGLMRRL
jgi:repressor LexA